MNKIEMIKAELKEYMGGYKKSNTEGLLKMMQDEGAWKEQAKRILAERTTRFLEVLPDEVLQAIAKGEVSIEETAKELQA